MSNMLAIIPARAGSKRIPRKNMREFCGKPLIYWTIEAALQSSCFSKIVVTTDDVEILDKASLFSSVDFYKRPDELAQDTSSSVDVIVDVMKRYQSSFDAIMLLQPTSPLRDAEWIKKSVRHFYKMQCSQLVSVRRCKEIPSHIVIEKNGFLEPLLNQHLLKRSQDWGNLWVLNGAIYISNAELFEKRRSFFTELTMPFPMPEELSIDIDTEEDWKRAEDFRASVGSETVF